MTITLDTFPARSRLRCCATCRAWDVRERPETGISEAYCPTNGIFLEQDLLTIGCARWEEERRETFAVELIRKLENEGLS